MRISRLPLDGQLAAMTSVLQANRTLMHVLEGARSMNLPGWYVAAGAIAQTVWNSVTGRHPEYGIKDYDLIYFDPVDLSWEAEDEVIRKGREVFGALPVEIRNQARVHLWYEDRFGTPCPPYDSTEAGIDSFPCTTCHLGVRLTPIDTWQVYAPRGLADVFDLVLRPNPVLAPREVYDAKVTRWARDWPELTAFPWPGTGT
ncbi:nucleotidyltransferase family protein [Microtetraspora malaysiensis]|uniref:nucleotidyltransferase family protein n=1 Tax=Microtetraspora malaysiensis TaxID=161358 RepID=UPI003D8C3925